MIQDMMDIKCAVRQNGGHWFDPATMRFFRSRVGDQVYQGPGGIYFVSSEQFVGSDGARARAYTVRTFNQQTFDVDTVGPFNQRSRSVAHRLARLAALTGRQAAE